MKKRVIVWGTGNIGRPALRAVIAHRDLELAGVVVSNPDKVGKDAGQLCGLESAGVPATADWQPLIRENIDAVVYAASSDSRPEEAMSEVLACLRAGINVVACGLYTCLFPGSSTAEMQAPIQQACRDGHSSLFVSGIDPGWAMDILPILASGVVADIQEVRCQEIFNYALYDAPDIVRDVIGFGRPMEELPLMLHDFALELVWAPMVKIVATAMECPIDRIETRVERRPLERGIRIDSMGLFEQGTQGAFRFEVQGHCGDAVPFVVEHITRIDRDCAPDWPYPPEGQGCHRVLISGSPNLNITVHGEDPHETGPAGGGNASAANRVVNAIPAVCAARPGIVSPLDLPLITGAPQLRR